jgi:hypothetical protein
MNSKENQTKGFIPNYVEGAVAILKSLVLFACEGGYSWIFKTSGYNSYFYSIKGEGTF